MKEEHLLTDRFHLLTEACESNIVSDEDRAELKKSGFGSCLLAGLPPWLERYSAHLVKYINLEKEKLQEKLSEQSLNDNLSKKNKCKRKGKSISPEKEEKSPAEMPEIQSKSEGVQEQRLQNLALTLDKVKHVLRLVFGEVQMAPPILQKLHPDDMATALTDGMELFGEVLHKQIAPHMNSKLLENIETKMQAQHMDPSTANQEIEDALVRLQHECRSLQCKDICDQSIDHICIYPILH
ncbi:hypothetical protein MKW92_017551 [Papaver armeniacum]|nr:hypothetical protein MKW92_017551 [Papaver armeniacum]